MGIQSAEFWLWDTLKNRDLVSSETNDKNRKKGEGKPRGYKRFKRLNDILTNCNSALYLDSD